MLSDNEFKTSPESHHRLWMKYVFLLIEILEHFEASSLNIPYNHPQCPGVYNKSEGYKNMLCKGAKQETETPSLQQRLEEDYDEWIPCFDLCSCQCFNI